MIRVRYLVIAVTLLLAACAGDDRSRQVELPQELPQTSDTIIALYSANQEATLDSAAQAANSLHSPDAVSTTLDGQRYSALVKRQNAGALTFDTETDAVFSADDPRGSIIPGHAPLKYWTLLRSSPEGATVSAHLISWNNSDPEDYLAAGYWLHLSGVSGEAQALDFENVESGVFVDAPELSTTPPNLPVTGAASYAGRSEGFYVGRFGTNPANPAITAGSTEAGRFYSTVQLTADFGEQTIKGCIGCQIAPGSLQGFLVHDLLFVDGASGERVPREQRILPYIVSLFETPLSRKGSFGSSGNLKGEPIGDLGLPSGFVTASSGSWEGNLSNKADEAGDPRLVAGTVGVSLETAVGGKVAFLGTFVGLKQPPDGAPGM